MNVPGEFEPIDRLLKGIGQHAYVCLDQAGRVVCSTRMAQEIAGLTADQSHGVSFMQMLPAVFDGQESLDASLLVGLSTPGQKATDRRCRRGPSGQAIWLEVTIERLASAPVAGITYGMSLIDVSEREHVEAHLRESLRQLNVAEETAGLGHWRLDLATQDVTWSKGIYRIHGFEEDDGAELENAINAYVPEDRERVSAVLDRALVDKDDFSLRATLQRPQGDRRVVEVKGHVELDEAGDAIALFGVLRDMTAESIATRELVAARDEASAAAQENMLLLATMSHEIRTPLSGIVGMLESLHSGSALKTPEQVFKTVEAASRTLMTVLNDVLDHAKIESGELQIEQVGFDLMEVAHGTLDLFEPSAVDKGLTLVRDVGPPLEVIGDPTRIQQIMSNFLSNAIKFTAEGEVRLGLRFEAGVCHIEVVDSGIGIDQSTLSHIFQPFTQASVATTRHFGGSGLGLSICQRLAEAMGGRVGADSVLGQGSRFWLTLPMHKVEREPAQPGLPRMIDEPAELPRIDGAPPTVLIVDDTLTNCLIAENHIRTLGARVETASNGLQALQKICALDFDAVLMDNAMPLLGGTITSDLIRAMPFPICSVPIVGVSADADKESTPDGQDAVRLNAVLPKPLRQQTLVATLTPCVRDWQWRKSTGTRTLLDDTLDRLVWAHFEALAQALRETDISRARLSALALEAVAEDGGIPTLVEFAHFLQACMDKLGPELCAMLVDSMTALLERIIVPNKRTPSPQSHIPSAHDRT